MKIFSQENYPTIKMIHRVQQISTIDDTVVNEYHFQKKKDAAKLFNHLIQEGIEAKIDEISLFIIPNFIF